MQNPLKRAWTLIERSLNVIQALIAAGALIASGIAAMTGHWDWRTAFFIAAFVALFFMGLALYGYRSRVAVRMFSGISKAERMCEADKYAAKRISEAKRSVWDFAWQDDKESNPKTDLPAAVRSTGARALDDAIRSVIIGSAVDYHEVLTTKAYWPLLKKHLGYCKETPAGRTVKYRARVYDNTKRGYRKFPKVQFVIIDEEEVIFMSSGYDYCFAMKNKRTASVFLKYAVMAWEQADEWRKGDKDVVLDGKVIPEFESYLKALEDRCGTRATAVPTGLSAKQGVLTQDGVASPPQPLPGPGENRTISAT